MPSQANGRRSPCLAPFFLDFLSVAVCPRGGFEFFADVTRRSVASGGDSATRLRRVLQLRSSFINFQHAGVDDAMSCGTNRVEKKRAVHRLAHGIVARKPNDTFETPPLTFACGKFCLIQRVASMKSTA